LGTRVIGFHGIEEGYFPQRSKPIRYGDGETVRIHPLDAPELIGSNFARLAPFGGSAAWVSPGRCLAVEDSDEGLMKDYRRRNRPK
jgi:hypothetical protein